MKKLHNLTCICILVFIILSVIIFIITSKKTYRYKKTQSIEYNKEYNEKYPIIDTIEPYYKNANRIFIRKGFNIGGHTGIGTMNGGSQMLFICDDCKKCTKK